MRLLIVNRDGEPLDGHAFENADVDRFTWRDERPIYDPVYFQGKNEHNAWWWEGSLNHRVEQKHIVRDVVAEGWFLTIESQRDLVALVRQHEGLVLGVFRHDPSILTVREVYECEPSYYED